MVIQTPSQISPLAGGEVPNHHLAPTKSEHSSSTEEERKLFILLSLTPGNDEHV